MDDHYFMPLELVNNGTINMQLCVLVLNAKFSTLIRMTFGLPCPSRPTLAKVQNRSTEQKAFHLGMYISSSFPSQNHPRKRHCTVGITLQNIWEKICRNLYNFFFCKIRNFLGTVFNGRGRCIYQQFRSNPESSKLQFSDFGLER